MQDVLRFDYTKAAGSFTGDEMKDMQKKAEDARALLLSKKGPGNDFVGWLDLPVDYDREEFARIEKAAEKIMSDSDVLIVIGIGGSYLGARAAIEFLGNNFFNVVSREERKAPQIFFCGNNLSSSYLNDLINYVSGKDFSINVISKSGTTTEPAVAFRIFKDIIEKKYGREEAAKRIYCTTDREKGALRNLATDEGYETFIVPDDIGGRYSVLTAVGLLPIAVSGADLGELMRGAAEERSLCYEKAFEENDALKYAAVRNILYNKGRYIEIFASYEPALQYIGEWWKQLSGESEGKGHKGIYPASVNLTADLHSMGQYIQDGLRVLFETVLEIEDPGAQIIISEEKEDLDGLNYLAGKSLDFINKNAMNGTMLAHSDGDAPNLRLSLRSRDEYSLGRLFYFYEFATAVSGYILGVNPFDQPGVESYKKNMFALLGKPGYEDLRAELIDRV